jgi:hypothetical protein
MSLILSKLLGLYNAEEGEEGKEGDDEDATEDEEAKSRECRSK